MNIPKYIAEQLGKPTGMGGRLAATMMNFMNRKMYKTCCNVIERCSVKKVLDIGFGNGYALGLLYKKINDVQLYGIDISEDAVIMAKKRLKSRAVLSIGNAEKLDFESDFFDAVYTINTVYFWEDPLNALVGIKRTIVPNGMFVNVCFTKQWLDKLSCTNFGFHKMGSNEMVELHRKAGFSSVELIEIETGKSFYIVCKKQHI